jgi:hypothetical protein
VATEFTVFEDDGVSVAYRQGDYRATRIRQKSDGRRLAVRVEAARGSFAGAAARRAQLVRILGAGSPAVRVWLNGRELGPARDGVALSAAAAWRTNADGSVSIQQADVPIDAEQDYRIEFAANVP